MAENNETGNKLMNDNKEVKSKNLLKQKRFWIPFFIIVIAGIIFWNWYQSQLGFVSTDDAFIDGNKLSLASKTLGRITALYTDEGEKVVKGQLLVRLDSTDLIAQRDQALMSLKLTKEEIKLAKVNLNKAKIDYDRAQHQYDLKIISKEEFEHTQSAFDAAQAQFNISNSKIGTAKAQLNVISTQLQHTQIYAPMNGVVAKSWVLEGDIIQPGQPILTIYDLDSLWVVSELQETDLSSIKVGQDVEISVDSYPDTKFEGKVLQLGTSTAAQFSLIPPSNAAGNFTKITQRIPVKISIHPDESSNQNMEKGSLKLLPGMSVEVKINVQK